MMSTVDTFHGYNQRIIKQTNKKLNYSDEFGPWIDPKDQIDTSKIFNLISTQTLLEF